MLKSVERERGEVVYVHMQRPEVHSPVEECRNLASEPLDHPGIDQHRTSQEPGGQWSGKRR